METLVLENSQVHNDMFNYLKKLEGKISHPPWPESSVLHTTTTSVTKEQENPDKQAQSSKISKEIDAQVKALVDLRMQ